MRLLGRCARSFKWSPGSFWCFPSLGIGPACGDSWEFLKLKFKFYVFQQPCGIIMYIHYLKIHKCEHILEALSAFSDCWNAMENVVPGRVWLWKHILERSFWFILEDAWGTCFRESLATQRSDSPVWARIASWGGSTSLKRRQSDSSTKSRGNRLQMQVTLFNDWPEHWLSLAWELRLCGGNFYQNSTSFGCIAFGNHFSLEAPIVSKFGRCTLTCSRIPFFGARTRGGIIVLKMKTISAVGRNFATAPRVA